MTFVIRCPHCQDEIVIEQVNCAIFRHGVFKDSLEQIPPHSRKEDCDEFVTNDKIYGCGKPFKLFFENEEYIPRACDYV